MSTSSVSEAIKSFSRGSLPRSLSQSMYSSPAHMDPCCPHAGQSSRRPNQERLPGIVLFQKCRGASPQGAFIRLLPKFQHAILGLLSILHHHLQAPPGPWEFHVRWFRSLPTSCLYARNVFEVPTKLLPRFEAIGDHNVFLPKKTMPPPRPEITHTQIRHPAKPHNLAPQFRLRTRVKMSRPNSLRVFSCARVFSSSRIARA